MNTLGCCVCVLTCTVCVLRRVGEASTIERIVRGLYHMVNRHGITFKRSRRSPLVDLALAHASSTDIVEFT